MKKKISVPKKVKSEIEKYPMVSVEWYDIVSDSSWSTFDQLKKAKLATCITKGHCLVKRKVLLEYLVITHLVMMAKVLNQ